jgi:hypothetical protein
MPKGRDKVTIKIPRELYGRLVGMIKGTGFGSVTEFVVYVMRDLAAGAVGAAERADGARGRGDTQAVEGAGILGLKETAKILTQRTQRTQRRIGSETARTERSTAENAEKD